MKLVKKGVALLLAIMLCLPALSCVAGERVQAADTQQSELDLLKNIQVISENFDPEALVPRGQAAQMLVCLLGLQDQAGGQSSFADVPANDIHSGAIQIAAKFGFLNGYSDGNYYPDKAITMTQAAKMLVSALGYDFTAVQYGGYPGGYLRPVSYTHLDVYKRQGYIRHAYLNFDLAGITQKVAKATLCFYGRCV